MKEGNLKKYLGRWIMVLSFLSGVLSALPPANAQQSRTFEFKVPADLQVEVLPKEEPKEEAVVEYTGIYMELTVLELMSVPEAYEGKRVAVHGWLRGYTAADIQNGIPTAVITLGQKEAPLLSVRIPDGMIVYPKLGAAFTVFGIFHMVGEERSTTMHYGPNLIAEGFVQNWDFND